jgi:hypothetical protein
LAAETQGGWERILDFSYGRLRTGLEEGRKGGLLMFLDINGTQDIMDFVFAGRAGRILDFGLEENRQWEERGRS